MNTTISSPVSARPSKKITRALSACLVAVLLLTGLGMSSAVAHNDTRTGQAMNVYDGSLLGGKSNDNGLLRMNVKDGRTDGHCVLARAHVSGQWRQVARSCGGNVNGSIYINNGNRWTKVNISFCIEGHIGKRNGCAYQTIWVG